MISMNFRLCCLSTSQNKCLESLFLWILFLVSVTFVSVTFLNAGQIVEGEDDFSITRKVDAEGGAEIAKGKLRKSIEILEIHRDQYDSMTQYPLRVLSSEE